MSLWGRHFIGVWAFGTVFNPVVKSVVQSLVVLLFVGWSVHPPLASLPWCDSRSCSPGPSQPIPPLYLPLSFSLSLSPPLFRAVVTVVGVSHGDLEASEVGHLLPWTHTLHYLVSLAVYIDIRCLSDTYLEPPWPPHLGLVTCFDSGPFGREKAVRSVFRVRPPGQIQICRVFFSDALSRITISNYFRLIEELDQQKGQLTQSGSTGKGRVGPATSATPGAENLRIRYAPSSLGRFQGDKYAGTHRTQHSFLQK